MEAQEAEALTANRRKAKRSLQQMCPQQNHLGLSRSRRSKCVRSQIINISTCPPALSGMMDSAGLLSLQRTVRSENIKNLTRSRDEGTCCCRDEDSSD